MASYPETSSKNLSDKANEENAIATNKDMALLRTLRKLSQSIEWQKTAETNDDDLTSMDFSTKSLQRQNECPYSLNITPPSLPTSWKNDQNLSTDSPPSRFFFPLTDPKLSSNSTNTASAYSQSDPKQSTSCPNSEQKMTSASIKTEPSSSTNYSQSEQKTLFDSTKTDTNMSPFFESSQSKSPAIPNSVSNISCPESKTASLSASLKSDPKSDVSEYNVLHRSSSANSNTDSNAKTASVSVSIISEPKILPTGNESNIKLSSSVSSYLESNTLSDTPTNVPNSSRNDPTRMSLDGRNSIASRMPL